MTDTLTPEKRSENMSRIRSRATSSTICAVYLPVRIGRAEDMAV